MYESVIPAILGFTVGILVTSVAWALAARLRESREDKIRARGRGVLVRISEIEGELDNAVAAYETGDTDKEALKKELSSGLKEMNKKLKTGMHDLDLYQVKYVEQTMIGFRRVLHEMSRREDVAVGPAVLETEDTGEEQARKEREEQERLEREEQARKEREEQERLEREEQARMEREEQERLEREEQARKEREEQERLEREEQARKEREEQERREREEQARKEREEQQRREREEQERREREEQARKEREEQERREREEQARKEREEQQRREEESNKARSRGNAEPAARERPDTVDDLFGLAAAETIAVPREQLFGGAPAQDPGVKEEKNEESGTDKEKRDEGKGEDLISGDDVVEKLDDFFGFDS